MNLLHGSSEPGMCRTPTHPRGEKCFSYRYVSSHAYLKGYLMGRTIWLPWSLSRGWCGKPGGWQTETLGWSWGSRATTQTREKWQWLVSPPGLYAQPKGLSSSLPLGTATECLAELFKTNKMVQLGPKLTLSPINRVPWQSAWTQLSLAFAFKLPTFPFT